MVNFHRNFLLLIFILATRFLTAYNPYKSAIHGASEWFPVSPLYQGGDRSILYIRQMEKRTLWNKVKYAFMVIIDEIPSQNELLITYWPLPASMDWLVEEENFLHSFSRRSVLTSNYQVIIPRKDISFFRENQLKNVEFNMTFSRGIRTSGLPPLEWEGLFCWGSGYFTVNSRVQQPVGVLDPEFRVHPTPLNQLVIDIIKIVAKDGQKRGAFRSPEPVNGSDHDQSGR